MPHIDISEGKKPYELWKQGIATKPDSIILDTNKKMILAYD